MMSRLMLHVHEVIAAPPLGDTTIRDFETMEFDAAHSANAGPRISEDASRNSPQCCVSEISRPVHETV